MVVVCCTEPEVAVTVTLDVVGCGFPPPPPPVPPPPPPLQPVSMPSEVNTSATTIQPRNLRVFPNVNSNPTSAKVKYGTAGSEVSGADEADEEAVKVTLVETGPLDGVSVPGLKVQLTVAGSPLHVKVTAELKPFWGETVNVTTPCPPELTVIDD